MRERNLERANSDNVWDGKTPTSTKQRILHATTVVTDRVSAERNAIGRVRPSVCFHSKLLNQLILLMTIARRR